MKTLRDALKTRFSSNYGRFMVVIDFDDGKGTEEGLNTIGYLGAQYLGDYNETLRDVVNVVSEKLRNSQTEGALKVKAEMERMGFNSILDLECATGSRNRRGDDIKYISVRGNYRNYETPEHIKKILGE